MKLNIHFVYNISLLLKEVKFLIMILLTIIGFPGKMSLSVASSAVKDNQWEVVSKISKQDDVEIAFKNTDVVIDFSTAGHTQTHVKLARHYGIPLVIGTTGLTTDDHIAIDTAGKDIAILQSGNFSLGVNLLVLLTRLSASVLNSDFDIEIIEKHHRHKKDAPSGTALMLGQAALDGRLQKEKNSKNLDQVMANHLAANQLRQKDEIGFSSIRGGTITGSHDVLFAGDNERITLSHEAENRNLFAIGALSAAAFLHTAKAGRYDMQDVLKHQLKDNFIFD